MEATADLDERIRALPPKVWALNGRISIVVDSVINQAKPSQTKPKQNKQNQILDLFAKNMNGWSHKLEIWYVEKSSPALKKTRK